MKKRIILLLFCCFFLTGCFDYQELNNRAIVVGIAIDYEDNEYVVNFEVLSSQKSESQNGSSKKSYLVEGRDQTLSKAYQSAFFKLDKDPYYSHLKVVLFSEEVAKNQLRDCIDYLIRDPNTRNIFYPVVVKNSSAKEILANTNEEMPIVSEAIQGLIDNKNTKESMASEINFERFLSFLEDEHQDAHLNVIQLNEDMISLEGQAIFRNYKMVEILNRDQTLTMQLLNNESQKYYVKMACEERSSNFVTINIYESQDTSFDVTEKELTIKGTYNATIVDDECNHNFKDVKVYQELAEKFQEELNQKLQDTTIHFMNRNSDVLGIQKQYYIKTRKYLPNWQYLKVTAKTEIQINKNGIIWGE